MTQVAAGDRRAQRQLVDAHLGPIFALARRMLNNTAQAEDNCQEAFLRLWQVAPRWQPDAKIGTWLYRITYNLCIDELRRQRRLSDEEAPEQADPAPNAMEQQHRREVLATLEGEMEKLPLRQRTAITLVHHQELSNIDAADIMEISVDALESLLARGRRKLRLALLAQKEELIGAL